MAIGVLVLGESGTGKTFSGHNFSTDEVKILSVKKPILPFRGDYELVKTPTGDDIIKELKNTKKKRIIIDDFQYILGVPMMKRVGEKGWDKFNEIQQPYADVLEAIDNLPDDVIVYINSHIEKDDNGNTKIKTIGKALDKYLTVEGLFMIVLGTMVVDGKYYFTTQNNGSNTVKSPHNMFPSAVIDNDLKYVDDKIRNYYHIGDFLSDDEMAEIDEMAKKVDIEPTKKKRRRGAEAEEPQEEEKPKRTRKSRKEQTPEERDEEIKEIEARNAEAVANAGIEEADGADSVPYEEVETPEIEKVPRRKRRTTEAAEVTEEPQEETPRRKRRAEAETATEEPEEAETADAAPTRRRRRRA